MSDARDPVVADAEWNAGDIGCGELVLELRADMARARPRRDAAHRLDPGAADIPAWCRMTGHVLVARASSGYLIARKEL